MTDMAWGKAIVSLHTEVMYYLYIAKKEKEKHVRLSLHWDCTASNIGHLTLKLLVYTQLKDRTRRPPISWSARNGGWGCAFRTKVTLEESKYHPDTRQPCHHLGIFHTRNPWEHCMPLCDDGHWVQLRLEGFVEVRKFPFRKNLVGKSHSSQSFN